VKTYSLKTKEITRKWYLIDASQIPLGRLSTQAATLLMGKEKPGFTPHIDNGDFVVIINASSLKVSGNKLKDKVYYRHSGFPGGLHKRTLEEQLQINPMEIIRHSIRGMLPPNKLRDARLHRLKIYSDDAHSHTAQNPTPLDLLIKKVNR
jgi:large subunit ribosomal protein L13